MSLDFKRFFGKAPAGLRLAALPLGGGSTPAFLMDVRSQQRATGDTMQQTPAESLTR